jgi:hypothetical protein
VDINVTQKSCGGKQEYSTIGHWHKMRRIEATANNSE